MKKILITGSAGFIGFHLAKLLLEKGLKVHGIDNFSNYYDVKLKEARNSILKKNKNYSFQKVDIENNLKSKINFNPDIVVHLAAQAGVRYSIENPTAYLNTNIVGTHNVLEYARDNKVKHLLMASTSSVYGANEKLPFNESDKCQHQMSYYAATKKSNEVMAHAYSHIYGMPITMFRFFTVYGPYGRPDMALFKFTKNIIEGDEIEVYNKGNMYRDFTYVDDLVKAIYLLTKIPPKIKSEFKGQTKVAKFRIINIGNSKTENLMTYIHQIEKKLSLKAKIKYMPIQKGDVQKTIASTTFLKQLTGFKPKTSIKLGVPKFIDWFRDYYNI